MGEERRKIPPEAVELYTQFIHGEIGRRAFINGLKRDRTGQLRRLYACKEIILISQFDIRRKIPPCLSHHPYRWAIHLFLPECT